MYGIPRGWGGTCRGVCITDQITDQYAPYCSELRYAVSSDYIELADYWWMQQEMNTLSVRQTNNIIQLFIFQYLVYDLLFSPHIRPHNIDLTAHFPHARTRSRIAASVSKRAQATHVQYCPSRPLWLAEGATGAGCGVGLDVWGCRNPLAQSGMNSLIRNHNLIR